MKKLTFYDNKTENILYYGDDNSHTIMDTFTENEYRDTFQTRIIFLGIEMISGDIVMEIYHIIKKKGEKNVIIDTDTESLSYYLWSLGIPNTNTGKSKGLFEADSFFDEKCHDKSELKKFIIKYDANFEKDIKRFSTENLWSSVRRTCIKNSIFDFSHFSREVFKNAKIRKDFEDELSVNFTEFFRNQELCRFLRENIFEKCRAYPYFKIWSAGCSVGMEPYSAAIMLAETALLDKAVIYATDNNEKFIRTAKNGLYGKDVFTKIHMNYRKSGGSEDLSDYFNDYGRFVEIKKFVQRKVNFFTHDLIRDSVFNVFEIIICKNVLIYYNDKSRKIILDKFYDSLSENGVLVLGKSEKIHLDKSYGKFVQYDKNLNIYRKSGGTDG